MSEPTGGRWTCDNDGRITNEDGEEIADVFGATGDQMLVNGRLMAASKELLEACETALLVYQYIGMIAEIVPLKAAIRKAKEATP